MNKKENEQLKKIEKLDQQLDNTISKIGVTKIKPIKISKKKLALFMLIPFSIACVISAVTSFLIIDPFHWYTKSASPLLQQQEKEIKRIKQQFDDLNLASSLDVDNSNKIADLLWELQHHPIINDIVKEPHKIIDLTSNKDRETKLSAENEEVNIKIIVRTGSLQKEIDVKLTISVDNWKVKRVNKLVKYQKFLDNITNEIKADGLNRVSNLVETTKTVINKNDLYKEVFNGIEFNIVNDKDDNEIIANGLKILNVNFSFTENSKLISSSVKLNIDLEGKSRKEINQFLLEEIDRFQVNFNNYLKSGESYVFFAQTVFANESTYQELINELVLFAPRNNFYLWNDVIQKFDNSGSKISVDFAIEGMSDEEITKKIKINDYKWWTEVKLNLLFFAGNGDNNIKKREPISIVVKIMDREYEQKESFLYMSKLRELITQGLFKYKIETKIDGKNKYGDLKKEIKAEVDELNRNIEKPKDMFNVTFGFSEHRTVQTDSDVISKDTLEEDRYYLLSLTFKYENSKIKYPPLNPVILMMVFVEEK